MEKDFYELLGIAKNSTDYEIYHAFTSLIADINRSDEVTKKKYINAFIVLSDIDLRKKYDLFLGLNYISEVPWYNYTYFKNGDNFFDINGNLAGDKDLTKFIETVKGRPIRSSVLPNDFFSEHELLTKLAIYTKNRIKNNDFESYIATQKNCTNLSDEEKFNYFKKIYETYKKGFSFSQDFANLVSSNEYDQMEIEDATRISAQQLLISKKGVCTHFASLIYEELKYLGLESYFIRILLPNWYHHVVMYRVNQNWKICDLTNEYLFGRAGYKINNNKYMDIPIEEFIKNNANILDTCIIPKLGGDDILVENSTNLGDFLNLRLNNESNERKLK